MTYLLKCSDDTYYIGITNNIFSRLDRHNSGKGAKYTRGRLPVCLLWAQECDNHSAALKLEYEMKQLSRKTKETITGQ